MIPFLRFSRLSILLCALGGLPAWSDQTFVGEDATALLGNFVKEQQNAQDTLRSLSFEMREIWTYYEPDGTREWNTQHTQFEKGEWRRIERDRTFEERVSDPPKITKEHGILVLNAQYLAQWYERSAAAYMYEHSAIDLKSKRVREALHSFNPRDFRLYAFGNGINSLAQIHDAALNGADVTVEIENRQDERELFEIKVFHKTHQICTILLAPLAGYFVTHGEVYDEEGRISFEYTVVPREVDPGRWFPLKWEQSDYRYDDGAAILEGHSLNTVEDVQLNPHLDDELFTWRSLPRRTAVPFFRTDIVGQIDVLEVIGNELVPSEFAGGIKDTE